ncbi:MAG TPA: hypothetical protein PK095_17600 [Myxococcota bacterium]|nr:hypothetical protein [Myxococcota bacterium]
MSMSEAEPETEEAVTGRGVVARTKSRLAKLGLEFAVPTNPKLEKKGLERFARFEAKYPPIEGDEVIHILDEGERERIRKLARRMILIAFGVGAASGLVSSIASFVLAVPEEVTTTFWEDFRDFLIVNGVTIVATMIEVAILYRFALQTVHLIAREAGIRLIPRGDDPDLDEKRAVALALARAALELPNPPKNPFGIDPYREIPKWRLVVATIFYKLKISLTNFILRILIRRIAGRAIVKAYLTFTDVFVTGAWDAWVAWRMTTQARIRALGPSACESLLQQILRDEGEVRPEVFEAMLRSVATVIVRDRDVHPNLLALMRAITRRSGVAAVDGLDDGARFLVALDGLEARERGLVYEVFVLSSFPDGRVSRAERELLQTVLERDGRRLDGRALSRLARRFKRGDPITRATLREVIS